MLRTKDVEKTVKNIIIDSFFSNMKEALLLIDIQNDYFPGGRMELAGMEDAAKKAADLLKSFRAADKPIFFIRHLSARQGAAFFIPGTPGADIHAGVQPLPGEIVIEKNFPNSFLKTELLFRLKEADVTDLVICGAMSHMCIDTTVRAAKELDFTSILVADACATRDLKFGDQILPASTVHATFMAALDGMFATVMTAKEYLS